MDEIQNASRRDEQRIDKMAKFCKELADRVSELETRNTALETCLSNLRGSGFKLDYASKLKPSPELLQAIKKAASECLPVQKTGSFKKDGKDIVYAVLKDYQEATNNALRLNNIAINFIENKETMELTTEVKSLSSGESRSITTKVEPSANPDAEKAKFGGFMKAKGKMLANLLDLD